MVFRRTRRMLSVLLAVLQGDLMYNAAVPSCLPIFGRLWGAAKPTFKLAEKYKDATDHDGSKKGNQAALGKTGKSSPLWQLDKVPPMARKKSSDEKHGPPLR